MKPNEIEDLSFRIIDKEAGSHTFTDNEWSIVRRMIHTSADFEYMKSIHFHSEAITAGINAIKNGKNIITDTEMVRSGIRKKSLKAFGGQVSCLINDPAVSEAAKGAGTTRAREAVDRSAEQMEEGIYAVGNAPTALMRLLELIENRRIKPALILGFPVGFVNAKESKDMLMESGITCIANKGRKGGSNIAASVVNALILLTEQDINKIRINQ